MDVMVLGPGPEGCAEWMLAGGFSSFTSPTPTRDAVLPQTYPASARIRTKASAWPGTRDRAGLGPPWAAGAHFPSPPLLPRAADSSFQNRHTTFLLLQRSPHSALAFGAWMVVMVAQPCELS